MAKIIILNAPPGAGKDTIANMVCRHYKSPIISGSFKEPMFEIASSMLGGCEYYEFLAAYNDRERKEKPMATLNGKSPRQFMIWISEDVIKPMFGKSYFGKRLAEQAALGDFPMIVSDGGFEDEVLELIRRGHEVKLCRLHRSGFTFEGDSRNYIHIHDGDDAASGYRECDYILVDGDPMHTVNQIISDHLK